MATSKISLSELKPGSCSRTVVLRFSVFGSYKCEESLSNGPSPKHIQTTS
ncbi:hypothetical protein YC2023_078167 [Brassica napus]